MMIEIFFILIEYRCQYPVCYHALVFHKMLALDELGKVSLHIISSNCM